MYKLIVFLGICSAFASGSEQTKHSKGPEKMVGCYYTVHDQVLDPQSELVKKGIDASLCNYLIYLYVGIASNGSIGEDNPYSEQHSEQFNPFNAHWKRKPQIKVLAHMAALLRSLSYQDTGNMESSQYSVFTDPKMRGTIVKNVVNFVEKYSFHGIDLDLSYMHVAYGRPNIDKKNLVLLLKALKNEFDKKHFILLVSVDTNEAASNMFYDIKGISDNVNFIKMRFDLHEPVYKEKKGSIDHNSPHFHPSNGNPERMETHVHHVVTHWKGNDAAPDKLILGITLSGIPSTFSYPQQFGSGSPFTGEGQYSYPNLPDPPQFGSGVPFTGEGQYPHPADLTTCMGPSKSDVNAMKEKANYAKENNLGGVVVQDLDTAEVHGRCGEKFPLLKALNQILRKKS